MEAARQGARLIVFPETWIPGYPAWLDLCRDATLWDHAPVKEVFARLAENALPRTASRCPAPSLTTSPKWPGNARPPWCWASARVSRAVPAGERCTTHCLTDYSPETKSFAFSLIWFSMCDVMFASSGSAVPPLGGSNSNRSA